jgi:hypothetical protein
MRALATVSGVQSLRSITARSASARVLNLHLLAIDAALDPEHGARPMFTHPVLNRTIIVKHHPRPGEFEYADDHGAIVTKIIFPFDPDDLDLGGQFLLVDDPDLAAQLERHLDYRDADMSRDLSVLRLLDRLPTLDPFLLHEATTTNKIDVAPCYFRLSAADKAEMRDFVARQVESLLGLCFVGAEVSEAQTKRLSDLILAEGDSPELDPLRRVMRMEPPEFAQAMFCWKAVLYYRWRSRALWPEVKVTRRSIASIETSRFDAATTPFVRAAVARLDALMTDSQRRIAELFRIYDEVFDALTEQRSPEPFRRFLVDGPRVFARLGERMGRLEQLVSFWSHQFSGQKLRQLSPEALFDGLRNLLSALSLGASFMEMERNATARVWRGDDIEAQAETPRAKAASRAAAEV